MSEERQVKVNLKEVLEIFELLERLNSFFHQPRNFESASRPASFVKENYSDIHRAYYETVWNWLPPEIQEEITR